MKPFLFLFLLLCFSAITFAQLNIDSIAPRVKVATGELEGINVSGIRTFTGVPYAAPPVGNLRWREPQPVQSWTGVRKADKFGARAMQLPIFSDMQFRSDGMSEDCLYLNVWTPAKTGSEHLPVLVYFYGGGFVGGDGSEYRYDGESMARKGIVAITVNYRLSVFGFFSHPELTKESSHYASGNQGLLDQYAALLWVQKNIAAFGGDPKHVTIAGESAGSYAVSAQMASPLSKNLIVGAIGESGSLLGFTPTTSLSDAEKSGVQFGDSVGAKSLAELRAMPAEQLLQATSRKGLGHFPVVVDGYFFPKQPVDIYGSGEQAQVPLLVGWNSAESGYGGLLGNDAPTVDNYTKAVQKIWGDKANEILVTYHANTDADVPQVATQLASDRFIGFSTWRWSDVQSATSSKPVYRYLYARPRPQTKADKNNSVQPAATGASHSSEIEYALGNLATNRVYDWQPEDEKVSQIMQSFFVNFITTGNPNGLGVPAWQPVEKNKPANVMYINVDTKQITEPHRDRYLFLEKVIMNK